jgi:hypothetical protein
LWAANNEQALNFFYSGSETGIRLFRAAPAAIKIQMHLHCAERETDPPFGMQRFLPDPITLEELAALRLVAKVPTTRDMDLQIRDRLLLLGFVRVVLGGLVVTNEGFLRIDMRNPV